MILNQRTQTLALANRIRGLPKPYGTPRAIAEKLGIVADGDTVRVAYCLARLPASARTTYADRGLSGCQIAAALREYRENGLTDVYYRTLAQR